jgi:DNA polymerase I
MPNGLQKITPENMENQKKLFLLDAYALIFRAYYAFIANPFKNSKGFDTSTIFGFVNTVDEILRNQKPSHVAVAFDPSGPTFRNELFPDYKANREETPENIRKSIPLIKKILEAYNIPVYMVSGFEADDVIGTLAKNAEKEGFEVFMMTPDKDYTQLVSENIHIYKPKRSGNDAELITLSDVCRIFDVSSPEQVIDILALWGDSSDNVPGVPGIGEKTAKSLISKYGNLDHLYKNLHQLKGKLKENLENFKEQAYLSKKLVTIDLSVPVNFEPERIQYSQPDVKSLLEIFNELEFKSLIRKYTEPGSSVQTARDIHVQGSLFETNVELISTSKNYSDINTINKQYHIVESQKDIIILIENIERQKKFCFDTETTSLMIMEADLIGIAFCLEPHKAYYLPLPDSRTETFDKLEPFRDIFRNEQITKVGQNLKFDIRMLLSYGIQVDGPLFDTMIAHYIIEPEQRHNLDDLANKYLNYNTVKIEELIGSKGKNQGSMRNVPLEKIKDYACEDADITWQLYMILSEELEKNDLTSLAHKVEMPLVYVLAEIENAGVNLNKDSLKEYSVQLLVELEKSERSIFSMAGQEFNISSPKQLGDILFKKLKVSTDAKLTRTKQYSTDEETLAKLADKHEIIGEVLNYRSLKKLLNTYVDALPKLVCSKTGKLHASFNQTVTATGRLSSNNPNLQNIPIREERGREIRKAFVPSDEKSFILSADYSQIELRLMAHMSNDKNLIKAFMANEDIHTATAALIHNVAPESVSREMRSQAKTANFGIIYGISAFGLAQRLNISRSDAKDLIDGYFRSYPDVKKYMDECISIARINGYVTTLMGRKRKLADILSRNSLVRGVAERNAINTPIQGSAADIIKLAMIDIHREIAKNQLTGKMILQVHDELVFDVPENELEQFKTIVKNKMESALELKVPLIVEMGVGGNWLQAH